MSLIAQPLEVALHNAFVDARKQRHEYITVEHLLIALCEEATTRRVLDALSVDVPKLIAALRGLVGERTPVIPKDREVDTQPTLGFQRVIQRAILHVQSANKKEVQGQDVLVAIYGETDSHAVHFLGRAGASRLDVVNFISTGKIGGRKKKQNADEELVTSIARRLQRDQTKPRREQSAQPADPGIASKVFISYSHVDKACLDRLLIHLKPLERQNSILAWSDQKIRPGDKWREKIEANLGEAAIAVLLVSADFLASDFIVDNELPPLLTRAESKGLKILQVILKPCGFKRNEILSSFQAINDPRQPLLGMDHIGQEELYNAVADEIAAEIRLRLTKEAPKVRS